MGNAVCPMVASALGRCLAVAALGEGPTSVDEAVVAVPDLEYLTVSGRLQSHQTCTCFVITCFVITCFESVHPFPKHEAETLPSRSTDKTRQAADRCSDMTVHKHQSLQHSHHCQLVRKGGKRGRMLSSLCWCLDQAALPVACQCVCMCAKQQCWACT